MKERNFNWSGVVAFVLRALLLAGGICFEIFNYQTTRDALMMLAPIPVFVFLAAAFCLIDIGALARIFTPETSDQQEPILVQVLFIAWALVSLFNALLTWYSVAVSIESNQAMQAPSEVRSIIVTLFPMGLAIAVWVIRLVLFYVLGMTLDRAMHGHVTPMPKLIGKPSGAPATSPQAKSTPPATTQRPPDYPGPSRPGSGYGSPQK
jgi:hypothetical protein